MGERKRILVGLILLGFIGSFSFIAREFSQIHLIRSDIYQRLLPQYDAMLEMEKSASRVDSISYLSARSRFLEFLDPTTAGNWINELTQLQPNLRFIRGQIVPKLRGEIKEAHGQEAIHLKRLQKGLFLAVLLGWILGWIALGFWGLGWRQKSAVWRSWFESFQPKFQQLAIRLQQLNHRAHHFSRETELLLQKSLGVVGTCDEIRVPLHQISGVIGLASDQVNTAVHRAEAVSQHLRQTQTQVRDLMRNMRWVVEQTERMKVLVEALSDLVDQAHLFLVNTAIESAQQGKTGRGFSQVAEEVGTLADGSDKAASELKQVIDNLYQQTKQVCQRVQQQVENSIPTEELTARTEESFQNVTKIVTHLDQRTQLVEQKFQELFLKARVTKEIAQGTARQQEKWHEWVICVQETMEQLTAGDSHLK